MSARWWTLVVWALAAGTALFWGFKLFVPARALPPGTTTAVPAAAARGDLTRLLGADAPPVVAAAPAAAEPPADARFQLIGVLSPRSRQAASEGVALIAVDGQPAKAYRVGALVDGQNVLQSVAARGVTLGPRGGAALVALNLPPPAPAATGTLPGVGAAPAAGLPPGVPGVPPQGVPPQYQQYQPPMQQQPPQVMLPQVQAPRGIALPQVQLPQPYAQPRRTAPAVPEAEQPGVLPGQDNATQMR